MMKESLPNPQPFHSMSEEMSHSSDAGRRIVVLGTNWVGDAVMSVAALRELRRIYPAAHLGLVVRPWVAEIYHGQNLVDDLIRIPSGLSLARRTAWVARRIRGYDLAILFPNSFVSALQPVLAGIPNRVGYSTDGRGWLLTGRAHPRIKKERRHQIYFYLDLLHQTGLSPLDYLREERFRPRIELCAGSEIIAEGRRLLEDKGGGKHPCVILNPGAFFGPAKRWFPERYAALADQLVDRAGAEIVLVGSPGERDLAERIQELMSRTPILLTGETNLQQLMALFSDCDLLITNDSGPMHLAAALGTPQIALFGSTDEIATGPFADNALVVHKHVACSPCLLRNCPIDLRCFDRIRVEEVLEEACHRLA